MAHVNRPIIRCRRSGRAPLAGLPIILLTLGLTLGLTLSSCAGDDEASRSAVTLSPAPAEGAADVLVPAIEAPAATAAPAATEAPAAFDQAASEAAPADQATTGAPAGGAVTPATGLATNIEPDRLLVVNVTIDVEVTDVGASVTDVVTAAARHDGQVYGSNVQLADDETATAQIVIKLPPRQVDAAIAEIAALGALISQVQSTDDVTDRVTDIDTRIVTSLQSVARVQLLLAEAKNLGEVVQLEAELTTRQTLLEELLAQQRNLGQQTALATLTVLLHAADAEEIVEPDPLDFEATSSVTNGDGIGDAFGRGGEAFVNAAAAVLIFVGYTAPFLAVGLAALGGWAFSRRRRARRSRSAAPLLPPAPDEGQRTTEHDSAGAART
jgi:hypothetical protein